MLNNKRVFVSGGAGVIGRELVKLLCAQGAIIFVGDLQPRPQDWPTSIRYRQGDLNYITPRELEEFAPEYVFHLAATFERSTETYDFWEDNYHHNVQLSHYLMDCLKDSPSLKKVVFPSSYLIYNPEQYSFDQPAEKAVRLKEDNPIYPRNLCGAAKLNHEIELRFLHEFNHRYETVCARIFRSYGKHSRDVISRWIRALLREEPIHIYKPEGLFDYIYAGDVAEGLIRLAVSEATGIINLGNDNARRVSEVVSVLKHHFPKMKASYGDLDIPYEASQADMTFFKSVTGWVPSRQIEDTIPELIKYEKQNPYKEEELSAGNVLVTSISRKVPMIQAVRQGIQKRGGYQKIIGADTNAKCIGRNFVDQFWHMPRLAELPVEQCIAYCEQNNITSIIPSRDGELLYFAQHKQTLAQKGIQVMVSNSETVDTCLDKSKFYQRLQELKFPVIQTTENLEDLSTSRYVVKERFGAGAVSIGLNLLKSQAHDHATMLDQPVFQPYIEGNEVSVDIYISKNGKSKGVVVRSRDTVVSGESQITTTLRDERLETLCADLVEKLGLYGHLVLQVIVDTLGNYHIIECNSRFGGASTLSLAVGLESFYWFLLEASGVDIKEYPFVRSSEEKRMVRYPSDLIV